MTIEQSNFQVKLNMGHTALWEHNWDGAVQAYQAALQASPENPSVRASLGLALFHQKNYSESLRIFQQLARENPLDPMPMERIARIYEREGLLTEAANSFLQASELQLKNHDVDRALSDFRAVIQLDPANQNVRARLGMVLSKLGKKKEAIAEFVDLAGILQRADELEKAYQILEYSLQIQPDSSEARNALDRLKNSKLIPLRELEPEISGAKRMAQVREIETVQTAPDSQADHDPITEARLTALAEIADVLFDENELARRQKSHTARTNLQPDGLSINLKNIQTHLGKVIDLHATGNDEQAVVELEQALSAGLRLPAADFLFGLLIKDSDTDKALNHLYESFNDPKYALAAHLLSGEINLNSGDLPAATSNYLRALMLADSEAVSEDEAVELFQLYEPILESQNLITEDKDMRNLCSAISNQLNRQDWRKYLAAAREQLPQQPEGAPPLPLIEMLIDSNNSHLFELLAETRRLVQQGMNRTAMEESFRALTFAPNYLPLHVQMGEILINEGRVAEAIEKFLMVVKLYTIRNDNASALRLLNRVTRLAPMDISVRQTLIDLLRTSGDYEEMIQQYMELANVHYLLADLDEARRTYHAALNLSRQTRAPRDQSLTILNRMADIELQSLNWKEAISVYEQIRSLLPLDPAPRVALVDLYYRLNLSVAAINEVDAFLKMLESENKSQEAEKFLDDLLTERPDDAEIQKRLVSFYVSRGQLESAVMKLDGLAEKLLVENNSAASAEVIARIIALNPANKKEYELLYQELTKK
jgi:tetratricopeptide (TPR) repeat protein